MGEGAGGVIVCGEGVFHIMMLSNCILPHQLRILH
jgi:hypothetical protein